MDTLTNLYNKRKIYEIQLANKQKELASYEDMYDTLISLKNSVEWSRSDFDSAISEKKYVLESLKDIKEVSETAKEYLKGMKVDLSVIGGVNVSGEFGELVSKIEKKKSECMSNIGRCEMEIRTLNNHIVGVGNTIAIAEQMAK